MTWLLSLNQYVKQPPVASNGEKMNLNLRRRICISSPQVHQCNYGVFKELVLQGQNLSTCQCLTPIAFDLARPHSSLTPFSHLFSRTPYFRRLGFGEPVVVVPGVSPSCVTEADFLYLLLEDTAAGVVTVGAGDDGSDSPVFVLDVYLCLSLASAPSLNSPNSIQIERPCLPISEWRIFVLCLLQSCQVLQI